MTSKNIQLKKFFFTLHTSCKFVILNSMRINRIKNENLYISGWYIATLLLAYGIRLLKIEVNFLSIYTFSLSLILVILLIAFGFISGSESKPDKKSEKREIINPPLEEKMKKTTILCLLILSLLFGNELHSSELTDTFKNLSSRQKIQLLKDIVQRNPFLKSSSDIQLKKYSIGKFFDMNIYKRLKGNDILGYEFNEGFKFDFGKIFIKIVRTNNKTAIFRDEFINSLKKASKSHNIRYAKNSPIEIGVALLDIESRKTAVTLPGAFVEIYFKNIRSGKYFYYRFGTGKSSGINDAFYDIWSIIFSTLKAFK